MVRRTGKKPAKTLWICCEGKTEKFYFAKLKFIERISRLKIKSFEAKYKNANSLVKEAINCISKRDFQVGDIIACVFDRNNNSDQQLLQAKEMAGQKGALLAFSNPSFEFWILCHFGYFPGKYEKDTLESKIKEHFSDYKKADPELYLKTKDKIKSAVGYARNIKEKYIEQKIELISRKSNPITLIFALIELIEKFR